MPRAIHTVLDFRIPTGPVTPPSLYVSGSRAETWDQVYLLHQLWKADDEKSKADYVTRAIRKFRYDSDTIAVNGYLQRKAQETLQLYDDVELHYCTSNNPHVCTVCGAVYHNTVTSSVH